MAKARITTGFLKNHKQQTPLVCLTAYTAPMAKIMDQHVDILLVGDTLGMIVYGMESTLPVTVEMMIAHGKAVVDASEKACVVVDMPFASYQQSPELAYRNAAKILKRTGCSAIKLEGGIEMVDTVRFLTERGIAVMGHVGLMPQHVKNLDGYKHQGSEAEEAKRILEDAEAIAEAGAFALVLEGINELLAAKITKKINIPTIGIGASPACDGQVLVAEDMLGLFTDFTPKFVKKYANLAETIEEAVKTYASEVREGAFPGVEHCYNMGNG